MSDGTIIPDVIGAIPAWRIWTLKQGRLYSVWSEGKWPFRCEMVATCGRRRKHVAPDLECGCGIYGYRERAHLDQIAEDYNFVTSLTSPDKGRFYVFGEVLLWGAVVPAEFGYRAQFAYPQRLYLPYMAVKHVAAVRANYGVRIKLEDLTKTKPDGWR